MTAEKRNDKVSTTATTIKVPDDLYAEIKKKLLAEGTNLNAVAIALLEEWVHGHRVTPVPPQLRRIVPMLAEFIKTKEEEQQFLGVAEYMRARRK